MAKAKSNPAGNRLHIQSILVWILAINAITVDAYLIIKAHKSTEVLGETTTSTCPAACLSKINQLSNAKSAPAAARELYVPLGSGTTTASDWTDVSGAAATIDTAAYGRIKQVTFEATTSIPTGGQRIWVRLYNATDKHPVWYSELTTDASESTLLNSQPITLDSGKKLYQVQMKTQLKVLTTLNQSRIKIVTY